MKILVAACLVTAFSPLITKEVLVTLLYCEIMDISRFTAVGVLGPANECQEQISLGREKKALEDHCKSDAVLQLMLK